MVGGWLLTRLMLISTPVEVVVEAGVELGNLKLEHFSAEPPTDWLEYTPH